MYTYAKSVQEVTTWEAMLPDPHGIILLHFLLKYWYSSIYNGTILLHFIPFPIQ